MIINDGRLVVTGNERWAAPPTKKTYIYIYGFFPKELSTRSIDMFGSKMVKHLNAVNNVGHGGYLKKKSTDTKLR